MAATQNTAPPVKITKASTLRAERDERNARKARPVRVGKCFGSPIGYEVIDRA